MPDVREVYHMVTQQKTPEPSALERQQRRQVRSARTKRIGAVIVAAVIGIAAVALVVVLREGEKTSTPAHTGTTVTPQAAAEGVAHAFLRAFEAFDSETAMSYVADGADLSHLIDGQVSDDAEGMSLMVGWLEAMGYKESNLSCRATATSESVGTTVECTFDFDGIRSDVIGRGPFTGSMYRFTVRDGKISYGELSWNTDEFGSQVWEPFRDWIRRNYPKDFDEMYIDDGGNYRLTPRSIRLWEQRTQMWAQEVAQ